jgi:hypothetical protein
LFGVLTGMAPGRFSVSVNYVSNVTGLGAALIEGVSLLRRVLAGNMPVTWAVRDALESRKTFKAAVKYLSEVPSLAPVLFAVAGTDNDERVVIERQPDEADLRWPDDEGVLALTNHRVGQEDRSDNEDSVGRFAFLEGRLTYRQPDAAVAALRLLSSDVLFQDDDDYKTQHQVVMEPRAGRLTVRARGRGTRVARVGQ